MTTTHAKMIPGGDLDSALETQGAKGERKLLAQLRRQNRSLREEVESLRTYRSMAYRDPLTGLRNRRYFDERIAEEVERARRHQDFVFSVLLIDLDGFKEVNDHFGHAAGDEMLRWVADFLERCVRDHDICCRTGGDEFVLLLPDAGQAGCAMLVDRLHAQLADANAERACPVSMSVGSATWPADGASAEQIIGLADARMYEDKERRGGRRATHAARQRPKTLTWGGTVLSSMP